MTPLQIQMLLHFHCSPTPFPGGYNTAQSEAINIFEQQGLISSPINLDCVKLTERGETYVSFLCAMPLPIAHWTIPGSWHPTSPESTRGCSAAIRALALEEVRK